ncbi:MAG: hypothetical protein NT062_28575 [Proteobacteria bacterium]|nr:hypothetical protein [Pseudomonadota bacterium]
MSRRHPIIFWLWSVLFMVGGVAVFEQHGLFLIVFLASPVIALVTLAATTGRSDEVLRARWAWPYRLVVGGAATSGLVGLVASAAQMPGRLVTNVPMSILFLLALVTSWRALTRPSPRRAAIPAAIVHVTWIPLLIANLVVEYRGHHVEHVTFESWQLSLLIWAGGGMLALSALASLLAVTAFDEPSALAEARVAPHS